MADTIRRDETLDDAVVCDFCGKRAFRWGVHVCATVTTGECVACGHVEYEIAEDSDAR